MSDTIILILLARALTLLPVEAQVCTHGDVRLVGGSSSMEGRVEICYRGLWGTVCDDRWGIDDGSVVCRQLGFGSATSVPCCGNFGQGTGLIALDEVTCTGNEARLLDCSHNGLSRHDCTHSEDAGVVCNSTSQVCTHGDVRLVGGSTSMEGRVEICNRGLWGTVCDDRWGIDDGSVVCRQLGFGSAISTPCCAAYGQGNGLIALDNVQCTGTEATLVDCPSNGLGIHNCGHSEDAGVICNAISSEVLPTSSALPYAPPSHQSHTTTPHSHQSHTITPNSHQSHTTTPNLHQSHTITPHSHQSHTITPNLHQSHMTTPHLHQSHTTRYQSHTTVHSSPSPTVKAPGLTPASTPGLWVGTVVVVLLLIGGSVLLVIVLASRRWRSGSRDNGYSNDNEYRWQGYITATDPTTETNGAYGIESLSYSATYDYPGSFSPIYASISPTTEDYWSTSEYSVEVGVITTRNVAYSVSTCAVED